MCVKEGECLADACKVKLMIQTVLVITIPEFTAGFQYFVVGDKCLRPQKNWTSLQIWGVAGVTTGPNLHFNTKKK
jgi:hypothetical protein